MEGAGPLDAWRRWLREASLGASRRWDAAYWYVSFNSFDVLLILSFFVIDFWIVFKKFWLGRFFLVSLTTVGPHHFWQPVFCPNLCGCVQICSLGAPDSLTLLLPYPPPPDPSTDLRKFRSFFSRSFTTTRAQTCKSPGASNTKIQRNDPPERKKEQKFWREREKRERHFGPAGSRPKGERSPFRPTLEHGVDQTVLDRWIGHFVLPEPETPEDTEHHNRSMAAEISRITSGTAGE